MGDVVTTGFQFGDLQQGCQLMEHQSRESRRDSSHSNVNLRTSYSLVHTKFACFVYRNIFAITMRELARSFYILIIYIVFIVLFK